MEREVEVVADLEDVVARFGITRVVEMLEHQVGPAAHDPCAVAGGARAPAGVRGLGCLERTARLGGAHAGLA